MKSLVPLRFYSLALATLLFSACGGGQDTQSVSRIEFSDPDRNLLSGSWPLKSTYLLVMDQQYWDQVWAERKAHLGCTTAPQHPACSQANPPAVNFSLYHVIGINFNQNCRFIGVSDRARVLETAGVRTIDFDATCILPGEQSYAVFSSDFFLLPRGTTSYIFKPGGV